MSSARLGLACLLIFALSQAVRDAFFANLFQSISFFIVLVLAFGGATLLFGGWVLVCRPREVRIFGSHRRMFAALNLTTAAAWIAYFFGLKNLEPAIVNTMYTGVGSLTILALGAAGVAMARPVATNSLERVAHTGVLVSLVAIAFVAVLGYSGFASQAPTMRLVAVVCVVMGGGFIAVSHMIAREFNNLGVGSNAIMGFRFLVTIGMALGAEVVLGQASMRPAMSALPPLATAAIALIVIPSYFLQLGVARASPLTVNVFRSLGPVFVFAVQQLDGRIRFSGLTLVCIVAFVLFATISSIVRGWAETQHA